MPKVFYHAPTHHWHPPCSTPDLLNHHAMIPPNGGTLSTSPAVATEPPPGAIIHPPWPEGSPTPAGRQTAQGSRCGESWEDANSSSGYSLCATDADCTVLSPTSKCWDPINLVPVGAKIPAKFGWTNNRCSQSLEMANAYPSSLPCQTDSTRIGSDGKPKKEFEFNKVCCINHSCKRAEDKGTCWQPPVGGWTAGGGPVPVQVPPKKNLTPQHCLNLLAEAGCGTYPEKQTKGACDTCTSSTKATSILINHQNADLACHDWMINQFCGDIGPWFSQVRGLRSKPIGRLACLPYVATVPFALTGNATLFQNRASPWAKNAL